MKRAINYTIPILTIALAIIGLSFTPILVGCSSGQRQSTLRGLLTTVRAADEGFRVWDAEHQRKIVFEASTKEAGREALIEYRTKREPILKGFTIVYLAISIAATGDDDESLQDALRRGRELLEAVTTFSSAEVAP